ncbi:MAG TPA: ABC transporter ATP-binding protein [Planctomycetes bacterium]|nr:ABC transporter ATP-binding protein [Planctomycetota bacterium]HIJ70020.1 ABC transporter ATP-binding protein [Planctomycetota bacterium]
MLELIDVAKSYESCGGAEKLAVLKGVNFNVGTGQSAAVVGPSGSGKSTLLNIMGALDYPTSGTVLFEGQDLAGLGEDELARIRNKDIGFVFQLHHLLPQCTVMENVLIPTLADKQAYSSQEAAKRAAELLERVGLKEWSKHRPGELSGGQRQRVAVVRALINRPKLLLADEPTGSLDEAAARNIFELLIELNHTEEVSLVVVTHSVKLAGRLERIFSLDNGVLVDGKKD